MTLKSLLNVCSHKQRFENYQSSLHNVYIWHASCEALFPVGLVGFSRCQMSLTCSDCQPLFVVLPDINECQMFSNLCVYGRCVNIFGMFRCECDEGYALDGSGGEFISDVEHFTCKVTWYSGT